MATTASSRLRKAFRYPSDSDSEPEDLDEEHQEQLITSLQTEDARKTDLYRKLFLSIPLSGALFFLYTLVMAPAVRHRVLAFLSFQTMFMTAYILHYMPIKLPERKGKVPVYQVEAAKGPVEKSMIYFNAALVAILQFAAMLSWRKGHGEDAVRETLPAIVFGLTMFVRQQLAPLNLEELQKARFELKGA